jgi:hypothetical protein
MMQRAMLPAAAVLCAAAVWAQTAGADSAWKKTAIVNVNFTQAKFDNWAPGGEDSWSWQSDLLPKFVYEAPSLQWASSGKFSFGQAQVGDAGSRKSADEIRLESLLTLKKGTWVNPYAAVTALTQFAPGYRYAGDDRRRVSGFLDPGYFTESAGVGYQPNPHFRTRIGAAFKESVARSHPAPYTDDPKTSRIEKFKAEPGAEWAADADLKLADNILFTSKLETFSNFKGLNAVDVNWDNLFSSKISRLISVSLNVRVTYDRDVSKRRQIKQVLAAGLSYALF